VRISVSASGYHLHSRGWAGIWHLGNLLTHETSNNNEAKGFNRILNPLVTNDEGGVS
jgi:hypothetical protein